MKYFSLSQRSKGFSLIELMVIIAILSVLAAIAIPNYIRNRNKAYCSIAERDAVAVSRALSAYYANPMHTEIPDPEDLKIETNNSYIISGDPNTLIVITVTDESGRCPDDYQDSTDNWDAATNEYIYNVQ